MFHTTCTTHTHTHKHTHTKQTKHTHTQHEATRKHRSTKDVARNLKPVDVLLVVEIASKGPPQHIVVSDPRHHVLLLQAAPVVVLRVVAQRVNLAKSTHATVERVEVKQLPSKLEPKLRCAVANVFLSELAKHLH